MSAPQIWQEWECPHGADADLFDGEMVYAGQRFHCHWCGGEHEAELVQTYVMRGEEMQCVELPKDAAALAALRASIP